MTENQRVFKKITLWFLTYARRRKQIMKRPVHKPRFIRVKDSVQRLSAANQWEWNTGVLKNALDLAHGIRYKGLKVYGR